MNVPCFSHGYCNRGRSPKTIVVFLFLYLWIFETICIDTAKTTGICQSLKSAKLDAQISMAEFQGSKRFGTVMKCTIALFTLLSEKGESNLSSRKQPFEFSSEEIIPYSITPSTLGFWDDIFQFISVRLPRKNQTLKLNVFRLLLQKTKTRSLGY